MLIVSSSYEDLPPRRFILFLKHWLTEQSRESSAEFPFVSVLTAAHMQSKYNIVVITEGKGKDLYY